MVKGWMIGTGFLLAIGGAGAIAYSMMKPAPTPVLAGAISKTAWDFDLVAIDGTPMPMSKYKGKVVLLVNTASKCGYTSQYEGLQAIHTKYADKGFIVLAVPSGNFMEQEFKSNTEISTFCQSKFGIRFSMAEKSEVVGPEAIPIYRWAATVLGSKNAPRWNFHKYLIGRDGQLIKAFETKIKPTDPAVQAAIEAALAKPVPKS